MAKRRALGFLMSELGLGERRGCRIVGLSRSVAQYRPVARDDGAVIALMRVLPSEHRIPPGAAAFQCLGAEGRLALCSVMVGSVHERDNGHKFAGQAAA